MLSSRLYLMYTRRLSAGNGKCRWEYKTRKAGKIGQQHCRSVLNPKRYSLLNRNSVSSWRIGPFNPSPSCSVFGRSLCFSPCSKPHLYRRFFVTSVIAVPSYACHWAPMLVRFWCSCQVTQS